MDTVKYCLGTCICYQISKSSSLDDLKPIIFISGKFWNTQCNYVALIQEVFAIYISVKRCSFYLKDVEYVILFHREPLEKFLKGITETIKSMTDP